MAQWQRTCLPMQEMQEMWVRSLGREDPLEKDMATHSSLLACKIPQTEGALWAVVHGVAKSRTWLSAQHSTSWTN